MSKKSCIRCYTSFIPRNGNCDICTNCKKPNKCEHGTTKGRCKIDGCFGNEICVHKQHKLKCPICNPGVQTLDKLNSNLRKIITKIAPIYKEKSAEELTKLFTRLQEKTKTFITEFFDVPSFTEVIGICKAKIETYENHYKQPLDIKYYQIDHIRPKSKFNLATKEELAKCGHYTNLQIVNKRDNLRKNNKWTDEDEVFWNENIIYKEFNKLY